MQKFDVCVVGGGASGSLCSILLAKSGKKVALIDKFDSPAKKLLVTGNGRCNITNVNMNSSFFNQNIDQYLNRFSSKDTLEQFKTFGLDIYADSEGRCYPLSNSAKTVQFVLQNQMEKFGVHFVLAEVTNVEKFANGYQVFYSNKKITNNQECILEEKISAEKLVFACGINEFSANQLKKFNIEYVEPTPSLVALKTKQNTKRLDGERLSNVLVRAMSIDKSGVQVLAEQYGEVLFKDQGLSGICIFNLSSNFAKNHSFVGKISINLLPNLKEDEIFENLKSKLSIFSNAHNLLKSLFSKELSFEILKRTNVLLDEKYLSDKTLNDIVYVIQNFDFDVVGTYSNNQVLSGGVKLDALTSDLESPKNKNLYFCGEICDVDGICGGYNLQWAWTSANIVADSIK